MKTHEHFTAVKECPFFSGLSQAAQWAVLESAHVRRFAARQTIFRAGDASEGIYVVVEGRVAITIADGPYSIQLSVIEPPAALGVIGAIDGQARTATATAETACELLLILRRDLELLGHGFPALWRVAAVAIAQEARSIAAHERDLLLSRGERLARWLLSTAGDAGEVRATQDQIALAVGAHPNVVSRLLRGWRSAGLLETRRGSVTIRNRDGLVAQAG